MLKKTKKLISTKRLDGKKKTLAFPRQLEEDLRQYCRERKIESESELIRQAIAKYLDAEYDDNTLKLSGLKEVQEKLSQLLSMISVLFSYQHMMHKSLLAYHHEIDDELKNAAISSASQRLDKFFISFRDSIKNDPPFFEKLLHEYVTGSLNE